MKLPVYRITKGTIDKMSLVEFPAVEENFLCFTKDSQLQFSVDEEKRIVFGVALRADYPIYRVDNLGREYYVVFEKEAIEELMLNFLTSTNNAVNLEHTYDTDKVKIVYSFIKDTEKGLNPINFTDVEEGSWFVGYKILDDALWQQCKNGEFNGFSVEGMFELEEEVQPTETIDSIIDELLK